MNTALPKNSPIGQLPPMSNLLAFESVARHQSLARAASELGVTKAALTHSIALLEYRLKLRLVVRYSPLVVLTPAGQAYFASSQAFTRRLRDDQYLKSSTATTQLRVSTSRGLARLWLGPRLQRFHAEHPRIELIVNVADRYESVLGQGVDVGIRYGGAIEPGMRSVPLWEDRHMAAGNPQLARHARFMDLEELIATLPLLEHPSMRWSFWAQGLLPPNLLPRPRIHTFDLHFGLECAVLGMGIAIAPRRLLQPYLDSGQLEIASAHSVPSKRFHAVMSDEQFEREPMQRFLHWIQHEIAADQAQMLAA